jgi:putative flippase GtrA
LALTRAGVPALVARIPAITTAMIATWLLNRSLTFRISAPRSGGELARYVAVALCTAALNYALYSVLVLIGVPPVPAVAISTICLTFFSFMAYRLFAFRGAGRSS